MCYSNLFAQQIGGKTGVALLPLENHFAVFVFSSILLKKRSEMRMKKINSNREIVYSEKTRWEKF